MLPDERVEVNQEDAINPPTPPPTYSEAMLQPPVDSTNGGSGLQFLAGREVSSFPGCRRRVRLILDVGNAPSNHQGQSFSPLAPNNAPINREHDFPRPGPNVQEDNDRPGSSNFHHACPAALPMSDSIFFGRSSSPLSDVHATGLELSAIITSSALAGFICALSATAGAGSPVPGRPCG
jgi:hypothetical protein